MAAIRGYRHHIDPNHRVLERLFGPTVLSGSEALARALSVLPKRFEYQAYRGTVSFDELFDGVDFESGQRGGLNCSALSFLLASELRRAGFSPREVFVGLGESRAMAREGRSDFHAWVFLRRDGVLWSIDPMGFTPERVDPEELRGRLRLHVVLNDKYQFFVEEEKWRALAGRVRCLAYQSYLYGQASPDLNAFMADPRFPLLLARLLAPASAASVEEGFLDRGRAIGVISAGGDAPGPRLSLIAAAVEESFHEFAQVYLDRELTLVHEAALAARTTYESTVTGGRWPWSVVEHTILAGLFLDMSIGVGLDLGRQVHSIHGQSVIWSFEQISAENAYGVHWVPGTSLDRGFGQLWHRAVPRPKLQVNPDMVDRLHTRARHEAIAPDPRADLWLRHLKLLSADSSASPHVPYFDRASSSRLAAVLLGRARRLIEEAIVPCLDRAAVELDPVFRRPEARYAGVRLLLEYISDRAVDAGILSPFDTAAAHDDRWGRWLWEEPDGGFIAPTVGALVRP